MLKRAAKIFLKNDLLCSIGELKSYRFGTTREGVINSPKQLNLSLNFLQIFLRRNNKNDKKERLGLYRGNLRHSDLSVDVRHGQEFAQTLRKCSKAIHADYGSSAAWHIFLLLPSCLEERERRGGSRRGFSLRQILQALTFPTPRGLSYTTEVCLRTSALRRLKLHQNITRDHLENCSDMCFPNKTLLLQG